MTHPPWPKWPPFRRRYFQMHICEGKFCILKFLPQHLINNKPGIGWYNGLVPNRRQAIIWTSAVLIHWRIYSALLRGRWVNGKNPTHHLEFQYIYLLMGGLGVDLRVLNWFASGMIKCIVCDNTYVLQFEMISASWWHICWKSVYIQFVL